MNFKTITHWFAGAIAVIAAFAVTPAGQALIKQYPYLSGVAGAVITIAALYHNPKVTAAFLFVLLYCTGTMAQAPAPADKTPIFSVSQQAVGVRIGGQTVAGSDSIGAYTLLQDSKVGMVQLQSDNILAPAINLQSYQGGVKIYPQFFQNLFAKTTLNVAPYFHGAFGIVRNVPAEGATKQHYSALADLGFDYKVNNTFSFGPRFGYFNAPGFGSSPHGMMFSANLTVVLGSK